MAPTAPPASLRIGKTLFKWGTRTYVMGVINAAPDSFSGDGLLDAALAAERVCVMVEAGAELIDVGAESMRPDAGTVDAGEEWARLGPALSAVRDAVDVPLSVDTVKAQVAERALDAGADAVNDFNGLREDSQMASVIARRGCAAILMHNQRGRSSSSDVIADISVGLEESLRIAERAGIDHELLILDPGLGFGWEVGQNLELLARVGALRRLGRPLLIGTSRKSTIGALLNRPEGDRVWGTVATVALAVEAGIDIVRVHDVEQMVAVVRFPDAAVRLPGETL
ncbi:MAG TPA: dihydropteroate synthase [Dehalococcoidia bacterium]|jgi:dihydropteroate synthase|nr:dihydropteroate synthase [Dehalococcoidia bacterium]